MSYKETFIITYIASYLAAKQVEVESLLDGKALSHCLNQPIEDAEYAAQCAWDELVKYSDSYGENS